MIPICDEHYQRVIGIDQENNNNLVQSTCAFRLTAFVDTIIHVIRAIPTQTAESNKFNNKL